MTLQLPPLLDVSSAEREAVVVADGTVFGEAADGQKTLTFEIDVKPPNPSGRLQRKTERSIDGKLPEAAEENRRIDDKQEINHGKTSREPEEENRKIVEKLSIRPSMKNLSKPVESWRGKPKVFDKPMKSLRTQVGKLCRKTGGYKRTLKTPRGKQVLPS